ncbi:MAG: hypothetical protein GY702_24045, partial [Desulfobulbaceae bacterium]|nr:hypothetical protein [Desulfobulbaceae bacterium]
MKSIKYFFLFSSILLLSLLLSSCVTDQQQKQSADVSQESLEPLEQTPQAPPLPATLPIKYQTASYVVDRQATEEIQMAEESIVKVGARITSTKGPQPLWDILKRLASLKRMNVSWSSDVDRNVLVDVDINANDDFFEALDNLLRQVDYHHVMQGSTIIVKFKETKQFHIAMPFIKQTYKTNTGGDVLGGSGGDESSTNVAGEISLSTEGVAISNLRDGQPGGIEFDTWNSIENNLNSILNIWSTDSVEATNTQESDITNEDNTASEGSSGEQSSSATFRRSSAENTYYIDKPVGLITVTAPRPLLTKLDAYFKSLKKELYKQVAIEAKILEVQLNDHSSIGLNWNMLLQNLSVMDGSLTGGKTYSDSSSDTTNNSESYSRTYGITNTSTSSRD